eukprot:Filipodium_phascolosomae@DN2797_c1_g1_i45.p1
MTGQKTEQLMTSSSNGQKTPLNEESKNSLRRQTNKDLVSQINRDFAKSRNNRFDFLRTQMLKLGDFFFCDRYICYGKNANSFKTSHRFRQTLPNRLTAIHAAE